jgi:predicted aspartyl protease
MRLAPLLAVLCLATCGSLAALAADDVPADAVVDRVAFLEVDEPNRVFLDFAPEGSLPLRLELDTGATHAVMTPLAARAAGVSVRALKEDPYRRKTRLGRDLQFYVDTLSSDTASRTGWEYGLVGGDFLKQYVVEVDFAARAVRFFDPRHYSLLEVAPQAGEAVVVLRDSPRPILPITIGGHEIAVLADTGQPWAIDLSGKSAKAIGIDVDSLPVWGEVQTTVGKVETRFYVAPDVSIGGFHFANVPVIVTPKGSYNISGETSDSAIGYDLLAQFLVRIDYQGRRMLLRKTGDRVPFYGVDSALQRDTGVFVMPLASGSQVMVVMPGSPAEKLGLRPDDFLVRNDPKDTPESMLRAIASGERLHVKRTVGGVATDVDLQTAAAQPAKP